MGARNFSKCDLCFAIVFDSDRDAHTECHTNAEAMLMTQILAQQAPTPTPTPTHAPQMQCGICHAQVQTSMWQAHQNWHAFKPLM